MLFVLGTARNLEYFTPEVIRKYFKAIYIVDISASLLEMAQKRWYHIAKCLFYNCEVIQLYISVNPLNTNSDDTHLQPINDHSLNSLLFPSFFFFLLYMK